MTVEFPKRHAGALQELATRLLESRKAHTDLAVLARDLLQGFNDVCLYAGLDELDEAPDDETRAQALVAKLEAINLDGGGPRNARPRQVMECLVGALEVAIVEQPDRSVTLGDGVRTAVVAAITGVVDVELAPATLREAIIAEARAHIDEHFQAAFRSIAA